MCNKSTVSFRTLSIIGKHTHFGTFVVTNDDHIKVTWSPKELIQVFTHHMRDVSVPVVDMFDHNKH